MTLSASHHQPGLTGVSLMRGETRLASVRHVAPDRSHPGCVHLQVWTEDPDALFSGTGSMQVHDASQDAIYQLQTLRCRACDQGYHMMATTLGKGREEPQDIHAEDYLVVQGRDPVRIQELVIADATCAHGPHIRCEVPAEDWSALPIRYVTPRSCACGAPAANIKCDGVAEEMEHRWSFMEVRLEGRRLLRSGVAAEVVRLGSRCTHRVNLYVALPGDKSSPAVTIGHLVATEHWEK